jgi:Bacterial conjugation TrbI-like protein
VLWSARTFAQNGQDRKLLFVNAPVDRRTTAPDRVSRPVSPFVVQAGTIIPAALITGIRSDLPGQITAQVTESYVSPLARAVMTRGPGDTVEIAGRKAEILDVR